MKKKFAILPMVAAMLAVFGVSEAQAELCAKKNGQVFSRGQCKGNESVVPGTPGPIGPAGPQGQTGAQGQAGPSGIDKSPCKLSSIAGVFSTYTNDDYSNSLESCVLVINNDGTVSNFSSCSGARNGVNIPVFKVTNGEVTMRGVPEQCLYRITYTKENGQSFMMTGSLNGTRENYNGFGEDFNGIMKGTMVSTRFYPVATSSSSAQTSNSEDHYIYNDSLNEIAKSFLRTE